MHKKKVAPDQFQSDLHAISPLPLDVVVQRLEQYPLPDTRYALYWHDSDTLFFRVMHQTPTHGINITLTGRLRRWEGTKTRIDIDSDVTFSENTIQTILLTLGIPALCLFVILLTIFGNGQMDNMAVMITLIVGLTIIAKLRQYELSNAQRYDALRSLNDLIMAIARLMTNDTGSTDSLRMIEEDDDDDQLAQLLRKRAPEIAMGADGELQTRH